MARRSKKFYVAYGSNLHVEQMRFRCPDAKVYGTGVLKNYSLTFWGNWRRNGVATVLPSADTDVPVVVWEISKRDEENLDHYEGWPRLYRKESIKVQMDDGTDLVGMVYLMNETYADGWKKMYPCTPSSGYFQTIKTGYESFGFDTAFLEQARQATEKEASELEPRSFSKIW